MALPDDVRTAFPDGRFSPPADASSIASVEEKLGIALPPNLRAIYLSFDGFREPIGNAAYVWQLFPAEGGLVSMTQLIWSYAAGGTFPDLRDYVFFGSSSADENWGMRLRPPYDLVAYHHHMGSDYETLGNDLVAIFRGDQLQYPTDG